MYRISRNVHEPIVDVDQVEAIEPAIRSSEPGRYQVDQIEREPRPSGHTSRRWGVGIKHPNGSVELEPIPWELDSWQVPAGLPNPATASYRAPLGHGIAP